MGGRWSDKTKLILTSTLFEVVVEVEVELGNNKNGGDTILKADYGPSFYTILVIIKNVIDVIDQRLKNSK